MCLQYYRVGDQILVVYRFILPSVRLYHRLFSRSVHTKELDLRITDSHKLKQIFVKHRGLFEQTLNLRCRCLVLYIYIYLLFLQLKTVFFSNYGTGKASQVSTSKALQNISIKQILKFSSIVFTEKIILFSKASSDFRPENRHAVCNFLPKVQKKFVFAWSSIVQLYNYNHKYNEIGGAIKTSRFKSHVIFESSVPVSDSIIFEIQ